MAVRVGDWYLCESYIDEPVQIKAVEPWRIRVFYPLAGKARWLGYPRIWQACRPQLLPYELHYDGSRALLLTPAGSEGEPPRRLTLTQLRAQYFPQQATDARRRREPAEEEAGPWDEDASNEMDYEPEPED